VLLRLVRALPNHQHDPSRPFRNWLKALVENAIRDFYRAQNRHPADRGVGGSDVQQALANLVDPNGLEDLADAVEGLNDPRLAAAMDRVRQRVADTTWRAFWAATADGRPAAEVAAELGISVGSVFKAKYRVASLLAQEYPLAGGG
jgi:RNA polymerase sigma-70 factor, ECF subfamily